MSRVAAFVAVVAAAVALLAPMASADPNVPWRVDDVADTPWQVAFVDFHYDCQANETVFVYNLTASHVHDLGHWTLSAPNCAGAELADDQEWDDHGEDGVSKLTGYRWAWGQPNNSSRVYVLRLVGEYGIAKDGEYAVAGDGKYAIGTVDVVPDCAAATSYPVMAKPDSITQDCRDELITAFPAGCVGDSCYKLVHTEVEYPVCQAEPHYTLTYRLEAEVDGCVWASQAARSVVFNDSTAPDWTSPEPVDATYECDNTAAIPPADALFAEDNCGIGGSGSSAAIDACEKNTTSHCPHHYYIVRSWTAIDDCGNERCTTQTITVTDSTAPTLIGVPDDERLTCAAVAADPTLLDEPVVTATDNCAGNLTADIEKHTTEIADECTNTFLIRRRWKVEDACGNEDEAHQLVTVYDDVPPVLEYNTSIPRHRTVECKAIPDAEIITAHDECADENTTVTYTQTPADPDSLLCSSSCNVLVTRHWTTCDDCGNVANLTRELLVVDRKAPTFDLAKEGDLTIECDSVPAQRPEPVSDVCDGSIKLATCTETRVNTTCEHEYVLTRFCEACDCCGNCVNRTRTITVVDTNITCPTAPTDESYQCNAIPAQTALTAPAQRCPETLGQTFGERPYTAACEYDIVRYWDFKDCANNTCTVEQTLSISDDIAPVFDSCPANTTADCHLPAALSLSAQDNCSSTVEITNTDENVTNPCPGTRLVKRTYTADDGCGNTVDCVQYIDVSDTTAPSWDFFPEDDALECDEEVNVETPRASDTCSNTTVVLVSDDTVYHGCANNYTRTITWKAVDQCGNTLGPRAQVIRVTDPSAPVLTEPLPADKVDVCHNISCPDDVFATDNCDGLNLTYKEERVEVASPSCDELYELHRTWTATDDCGQTDTHTQVITVSDPDAPVYNGGDLEDEEISCEEDIVLPTDPSTNWTDNCGDVTLVSITNRTTPSFECATNETVTVTWTVRDECGNTASVSKKYKIYDLTQPDIEDLDDKTFECDETVVLEEPWHNDTCSNTILTATNVTTPLDCPTTGYLSQTVRNFTATDLCGNQVHSSQVTRVTDTTDPVMTCPDAVITGTCCSVPPPAVLTATDNCADPQDIEAVVTRQNGSCVNTYNLTYTWTAYDQCDNFKQCVQTVVIVDDQVPTLEGVPTEDASAECEDVPKPEQVCAHDNCGPISLHFNETRLNGSCSARFTLRREWTAVDACGHDYSESYDLTVTDDNDPYWGALPSDDSRECDKKNVDPTFADPSCTDNCTVTDVTPSTNQQVVGCPGDIDFHFGWECADECGNSITHNITVEQRDTTDPQFIWAGVPPQDVSYDCAAPGPETPGVTDSCTDAFLSFDNETELDVNASCPIQRSWVRVWNVTDECDHFVVHRQKVSINRPGPPVFTTNVSDATIGCHSTEPATPIVKAKDACGNEISVSLNRTEVNHTCTEVDATASQYDIVRTWTAVDSCGQEISLVQVIRVRDMSPPTVTAPAPRTFHNKCVQQAKPTGATHSDDCISIINCTDEDLNVGTCPYAFDINTTFTATDNCGKQTSDSVRETYTYDKKPQVHDRENISTHRTARCDDVNTVPDTIQWQDGCGQNISGGELDTYVIDGACPNNYTLVWNYSITDYCGQSNFFVIRTHVLDESAPQLHFEWPVEDELVECPFVSPAPEATATDSCGGNVTIEFVEFKVGFDDSEPDHDCCNYDVFRVWKATDACGHTSTKTQRIQVKDTIPPVWVGPDIEDVDIVCPEVVERPNITWFEAPFAHGFCASATNSTNCTDTDTDDFQFVLDGQEYTLSNGRFVRWVNGVAFLTGEAVGASATYTVDFQFNLGNVSTSAGLAQSLANNTLKADCYDGSDGVVRAQWVFYEELVGNLTETTTGDLLEVTGGTYLQLGLGANGRNELYGLRTTLTATPEGGAALEGELALQLNDCNTSDWGLPELECGHELETTESFTHEEECIGRYTHVFIWNATDPAGNTNSTTMTVTSEDLTPPQFYDLPATLVTGVCAEPAVPTVKANDTCSYANISLSEGPKIPFGPADCEYKFTRVRTWTAIDDCLNPNDFVQNVEVEDDVDPTITLTGVPTNKTFDCYADLPAAATASCSDNCDDNVKSCTSSDNAPATPSNCNVFITYTYNAEDKCGNSETDSYTVHVNDVNAPVCISVGDDKELCGETDVDVPCADGVPAKKDAIYTDNCDGTITVTPSRSTTGTCPTIVVDTYTLVDSCGNVGDTFTKTYRIVDDVDPVITTPANRTVGDCTSWEIPAADENVTVSDVCDTSLSTVTHDGDSFTYEGDCLVLVTRHWSAVDACGNDVTAESYIHINDTSAPVFDPPSIANEVINCTEDVPCPPTVSITDGCDGVHLNYKETEVPGRCDNERVLVRTWTATDSCGNSATLTYNISITDTIDPEWVGALPVNESIECDEDAAGRINLNATDSCGPAPTTFNETRINGSCPHEYQLLREWVATDACGNSIDHSVTIHVNDTEAPTVADLTDKVHECDRTVPEFDVPTFNDNCDLESVTNVTGTTSQGCNGNFTVTNTWTGTDSCGNSETVDQDIVVTDTVAPRFTSTPQRVVNSTCTNGSEPFPTYEDDCSLFDEITATSTDELERLNLPCLWPYRIERSWTITDDCLHSTTVYQTVNVKDEDKPSLIWEDDLAPEDATVACDQIVPWTPVTANDPCQGDVTDLITNTSTGTPDACDWTETRFWEVCDCSGNCDNHTQVIHYVDEVAPVFDDVADAGPFVCNEAIVLPNATATDDQCTEETFEVQPTTVIVPGACTYNYTLVATYFVVDRCGNNNTVTKNFTHHDITPPVPDPVSNVTIECGDEIPEEFVSCTDNCDGHISGAAAVTSEQVDDGDDCENTKLILQTYTCTDQCGNSDSVSRYVIVEDTVAPTIDEGTLPPNSCTECAGTPDEGLLATPVPDLPFTQIGYIRDAESGTGNCSHPSGGHGVIFGKWKAFNIDEDSDPTWRLFREGEGVEQFIKLDAEITATDMPNMRFQFSTKLRGVSNPGEEPCDAGRDEFVPLNGACGPHYEFPFSHRESWAQCYDVGAPADKNEWTQYSFLDYGFLLGIGDCAGAEITFTPRGPPFQMGFGANGKSIAHGGSSWLQWKVISQAAEPSLCPMPDIGASDGDINIEMEPWDGRIIPNDCPDNATLTNNTVIETGGCPANYTEVVTWTVTDCVGNSNNATRRFAHKDTTPPTISNISLPEKLECGETAPEQFPVGSDICDGDVDVSGPTEVGREGDSCNLTITYRWSATDDCLNSVTQDHSISFCDTTDPDFTGSDTELTFECNETRAEPAEDKHAGTDSCSTVSTAFTNSTEQNGCEDNYTVTYTWTATDACGNNASIEEVHVVTDNQPPTIVAGEPECIVDSTETLFWVLPDITKNGVFYTASDSCDETPNITITSCTSDQDAALGVTPDGSGFSDHCFYVPEEDALYLRRSINQTDLAGRLYTVTGVATDNCGNTDDVDRLFLIANGLAPFMGNDSSWELRGLEIEDTSRCGAAQYCVHMCPPCVYDVNFCSEGDDESREITLGDATYDASSDSTVFVYTVSGDNVRRVTLGLNLAEAELLELSGSESDAQRFGFQRDSYFSGVSWSEGDSEDLTVLTFRLRGNWTSEEDNTAYEIKWETDDDSLVRIGSVPGPCKRDNPGTVAISGTIGVSGTVYGPRENDSVLALGGIVVKLQEKTLWSPETYAYTMTAADGSYSFTNLNVSEQYQVVIDEEGFLEGALQGAHRYLTTDTNALVNQYGEPRCVPTVPANDANMNILIDELRWDTDADRARYLEKNSPVDLVRGRGDTSDTNFNGNAKSVSFWVEQYRLVASGHHSLMTVEAGLFGSYSALADTLLAGFGASTEDLLTSGSEYQQRVAALALNHYSGFGVLRPFRELQTLVLNYAVASGPAPATESVISAMLLKMLQAN